MVTVAGMVSQRPQRYRSFEGSHPLTFHHRVVAQTFLCRLGTMNHRAITLFRAERGQRGAQLLRMRGVCVEVQSATTHHHLEARVREGIPYVVRIIIGEQEEGLASQRPLGQIGGVVDVPYCLPFSLQSCVFSDVCHPHTSISPSH